MTYHVLVQFDVPPSKRDAFVAAGLFDAEGSLANEPGTLRFEVIRDEDNPNRIYLDEVYTSREAFEEHCNNETIKKFYERVDSYAYGPNFLFKGYRAEPKAG
ncbi:putative quinol monooxygenase [Streptomyces pinistramenti]|uniref:putative quinol monooxygenase n=1 Tax=Streptomyces pinistramenti TaxID=2884812 RepID=UPI001D078554|nr:putative quinol monooxygenase [Streptomyces pinistramenti]MCB5906403.1 antibiotic biosynthesis monooxygenase [Streptomyces pinistramenti]